MGSSSESATVGGAYEWSLGNRNIQLICKTNFRVQDAVSFSSGETSSLHKIRVRRGLHCLLKSTPRARSVRQSASRHKHRHALRRVG